MEKYVDLSQTVTASYYDEEHEEWRFKERTIEDLLDDLCDDYTTTDAVPVKRGKWIIGKFGDAGECSVCGMRCGEYDLENSDRYCRCCGALMEGLERRERD